LQATGEGFHNIERRLFMRWLVLIYGLKLQTIALEMGKLFPFVGALVHLRAGLGAFLCGVEFAKSNQGRFGFARDESGTNCFHSAAGNAAGCGRHLRLWRACRRPISREFWEPRASTARILIAIAGGRYVLQRMWCDIGSWAGVLPKMRPACDADDSAGCAHAWH
jgi:hypothetical protein